MNKKKAIRFTIEAAIVIIMICVFVIFNDMINERNDMIDEETYIYHFDKIECNNESGEFIIKGWLIKEGVECSNIDSRSGFKLFLAENNNPNTLTEIPLEITERKDVTRAYGEGKYNYDYSGFLGIIKIDSTIKENWYRLLIQFDSSEKKYIFTSKLLDKGKIITE